MKEYIIRKIEENDYNKVARIYNSNPIFLKNHLGVSSVDETFVAEEVKEMLTIGFNSYVIENIEKQTIEGILDFKLDNETYLSLLMLDKSIQKTGVGSSAYHYLEKLAIKICSKTIRIDVVYDYQENSLSFWKKLGFSEHESINHYNGRYSYL